MTAPTQLHIDGTITSSRQAWREGAEGFLAARYGDSDNTYDIEANRQRKLDLAAANDPYSPWLPDMQGLLPRW